MFYAITTGQISSYMLKKKKNLAKYCLLKYMYPIQTLKQHVAYFKKHGDGSLAIVKRMLKAEQTMSMLQGITFG